MAALLNNLSFKANKNVYLHVICYSPGWSQAKLKLLLAITSKIFVFVSIIKKHD